MAATSTLHLPTASLAHRTVALLVGLVLCGVGIALTVRADLGLGPWDVFHQGVAERTGVGMGSVVVLTGLVVLLLWIPLRQRPGVGTLANAVLIGVTADVALHLLPEPDAMGARVALMVAGVLMFGPGSGLYIGAGMGPGPRDGLMTGLAAKGPSVRLVRTLIELSALAAGLALGGTAGAGTVLFALTIGPNVQFWLDRLAPIPRHLEAPPEVG